VRDQEQIERWWKSPQAVAWETRRRARVRARARAARAVREEVADPEEYSSFERERSELLREYFSRRAGRARGNPLEALPRSDDLVALAETFAAAPNRLLQALALQARGLAAKAKRLVLCGRIGKRQNCQANDAHRFFRTYRCGGRYCERCGPIWFRGKFSDLLVALPPIVEHLLHEGTKRGRRMVIAKLDFTVPNRGTMPSPKFVRQFHADLHRFWRAAERRFRVSPREYGWAGADELGGGNTNLHRHCVYIGPWLPQRRKELSALWSEIRGERSFVSIKMARSLPAALAHALKYPAKFLSQSTAERLAELELTFHKTRRFSTGGAFYRIQIMREPGEESPIGECPVCGAALEEILEPWSSVLELEREGRRDVEAVRRELSRQAGIGGQVFGVQLPP
jgi:hypothetical protein